MAMTLARRHSGVVSSRNREGDEGGSWSIKTKTTDSVTSVQGKAGRDAAARFAEPHARPNFICGVVCGTAR